MSHCKFCARCFFLSIIVRFPNKQTNSLLITSGHFDTARAQKAQNSSSALKLRNVSLELNFWWREDRRWLQVTTVIRLRFHTRSTPIRLQLDRNNLRYDLPTCRGLLHCGLKHFRNACKGNNVHSADLLYRQYLELRANYCG